jgi:7-cyano-7-deazaguanine tRNA-ribosyltransferase
MKYFVSWTNREPCFQLYDSACNILISPANLPSRWSIKNWSILPRELLVDSGAYSIRNNSIPSCIEVLEKQLSITNGWPANKRLLFSHPDLIIPIGADFKDTNSIIAESLKRAKVYFGLVAKSKSSAVPIGVIHGFDEESLFSSYMELKDIGYVYFALGSLGVRFFKSQKDLCMKAINIVSEYEISPIHVFGVTLPLINLNTSSYRITSYDTSAPTKLAYNGIVLYGTPLKRYVITSNAVKIFNRASFSFSEIIPEPLKCNCPVCKCNPHNLYAPIEKEAKLNRILHNYFQIKWETENIH